jgi:hypothetical protein
MGLAWQAKPYGHLRYESLVPSPDVEGFDSDSESEHPKDREAKRRRIENYARQYLRGEPVFIASASLKGPFPPGWLNPWRKSRAAPPRRNTIKAEEIETEVDVHILGEDAEMEDSASEEQDAMVKHGGKPTYNRIRKEPNKDETSLDSISAVKEVAPVGVESRLEHESTSNSTDNNTSGLKRSDPVFDFTRAWVQKHQSLTKSRVSTPGLEEEADSTLLSPHVTPSKPAKRPKRGLAPTVSRHFSRGPKSLSTLGRQRAATSRDAQRASNRAVQYTSDSSTRGHSTRPSDMVSTSLRKSSESSRSDSDDDKKSTTAWKHFKALPQSMQVNFDSSLRSDLYLVRKSAEVDVTTQKHARIQGPDNRRYKYTASPAADSRSPFAFGRPSSSKNGAKATTGTKVALQPLSTLRSEAESLYPPSRNESLERESSSASATSPTYETAQEQNDDEQDEDLVFIQLASDGKWYCPVQNCEKAQHGYSEGGLRTHVKGVMHRMQPTTVGGVGKRRILQSKISANGMTPGLSIIKQIPKSASAVAPEMDAQAGAQAQSPSYIRSVGEAPSSYASQAHSNQKRPRFPAPPIIEDGIVSAKDPEPAASESLGQPENPIATPKLGDSDAGKAAADSGNASALSEPPLIIQAVDEDESGRIGLVHTFNENVSHGIDSVMETGPTIPDRQDSRAFSTWTFNQSTQCAMLDAGRAFQETQTPVSIEGLAARDDEQPALNNIPLERHGAITPFRILNAASASGSTSNEMAFNFPQESTQQLLNEAEAMGAFSTVKKRKQPFVPKQVHISWGISKPTSQTDMAVDASICNTTPVPATNKSKSLQPGSVKPHSFAQLSNHHSVSSAKLLVTNSYPIPSRSDITQSFPDQDDNPKTLPFASTATSTKTPTLSQFLTASAPTPMPVASYQQGQNINDSRGLFRSGSNGTQKDDCSMDGQDVEAILDSFDEFLKSGDVDGDIRTVERERRRTSGFVGINS